MKTSETGEIQPAPSKGVNFFGVLSFIPPLAYPLFRVTAEENQLCPLALQTHRLKTYPLAGEKNDHGQALAAAVKGGTIRNVRIYGPIELDGEQYFQLFEAVNPADPRSGTIVCMMRPVGEVKAMDEVQGKNLPAEPLKRQSPTESKPLTDTEKPAKAPDANMAKTWASEQLAKADEFAQVYRQKMDRRTGDQSGDGGRAPSL